MRRFATHLLFCILHRNGFRVIFILKQIIHKPFPNHLGRFSARRNERLVVMKSVIERWKQKARDLKKETFAIYLAYKDPRVPW